VSRSELKAVVDRCSRAEQRYLLAYLRSKEADYGRKLGAADRELESGRGIRLRVTRRGLVRAAA